MTELEYLQKLRTLAHEKDEEIKRLRAQVKFLYEDMPRRFEEMFEAQAKSTVASISSDTSGLSILTEALALALRNNAELTAHIERGKVLQEAARIHSGPGSLEP